MFRSLNRRTPRRLAAASAATALLALTGASSAMADDPIITVGGGQITIMTVEGDLECTTYINNSGTRTVCVRALSPSSY